MLALLLSVQGRAAADLDGSQFDGFVYMLGAVDNSDGPTAIEAFGREAHGGRLQRIGRFLTGGTNNGALAGAQQDALVSRGDHVYAVNPGSNTLSALSIQDNGRLSLIQQVSSGGLRPVSIAIHGDHLYVANAGQSPIEEPKPATIVGFSIGYNGSLSRLPCAPGNATPGELGNIVASIAINPSGTVLIVAGLLSNKIDSFRIDQRGCLEKRDSRSGGGGAFAVNFRPSSDNAVITRALPEFFTEQAPGVGSFEVGDDGSLSEVSTYVDPDTSDAGLRDPCWTVFSRDGSHFWVSSFIPRSITAFSLDHSGRIARLSEHQPTDTAPDPTNPGGTVVVGSFDLAADTDKQHIFQTRAFAVPNGQVTVPSTIHTYEVTGHFEVNAGLREVQVTQLPADFENPSVTGLIFVDRAALH